MINNFIILQPAKPDSSSLLRPIALTKTFELKKTKLDQDIMQFVLPFKRNFELRNVKNSVYEIHHQLFKIVMSHKLYPIVLTSQLLEQRCEQYEVLNESNNKYDNFYFVLETRDFYVREINKKEDMTIVTFPKYFVIQTLYPFSRFFHTILESMWREIKQERKLVFTNLVQKKDSVDLKQVALLDCEHSREIELKQVERVLLVNEECQITNNFGNVVEFKNSFRIKFRVPVRMRCRQKQAEFA